MKLDQLVLCLETVGENGETRLSDVVGVVNQALITLGKVNGRDVQKRKKHRRRFFSSSFLCFFSAKKTL